MTWKGWEEYVPHTPPTSSDNLLRVGPAKPTRSKYGAVKTTVDGITFASKKEAHRFGELKLLREAGEIQHLQLQRALPLCAWNHGEPVQIGKYVADFSYCTHVETAPCAWCVLEDVKGFKTPMYRWKKRHVKAQYNIEISEV